MSFVGFRKERPIIAAQKLCDFWKFSHNWSERIENKIVECDMRAQ